MFTDIFNGDNDLAGYLLTAMLALPAAWITMAILDWQDGRNRGD